jgi:hypothetical protein
MDELSQVWLDAADAALSFVEDPRVGERWADPSSLPGMTVGALAGHLVQSGVLQAGNGLVVGEPPAGAPITAAKMYSWIPLDLASPVHETVRALAASQMVEGREDLIERGRASWRQSEALLAEASLSRVVAHPVTPTLPITLGEFLRTRILELVVHVDDLAHSIGVEDPPIDQRGIDITCQLGIEINVERYGSAAVLRALFRRDRYSLDALRTF